MERRGVCAVHRWPVRLVIGLRGITRQLLPVVATEEAKMRWEDLPQSDNIDDRRGAGGGFGGGGGMGMPIGGGGLGIGTIVVLGIIGYALGIDPRLLIGGA